MKRFLKWLILEICQCLGKEWKEKLALCIAITVGSVGGAIYFDEIRYTLTLPSAIVNAFLWFVTLFTISSFIVMIVLTILELLCKAIYKAIKSKLQ